MSDATLKIISVWVRGNVPYEAEYVRRLRRMCLRHVGCSFDFYALTDRPEQLRGEPISVVEVQSPIGYPGWWSKLEMFNPRHELRGPAVYLDLDVLLTQDAQPIVDFPGRIAFAPHAGSFEGARGLRVVKNYNTSVIKFDDVGAFPEIYTKWNASVAKKLWGDQDWIGQQMPHEEKMPIEWFPRVSQIDLSLGPQGISPDAKVVLCKRPKNHEIARSHRWFDQAWGGGA